MVSLIHERQTKKDRERQRKTKKDRGREEGKVQFHCEDRFSDWVVIDDVVQGGQVTAVLASRKQGFLKFRAGKKGPENLENLGDI